MSTWARCLKCDHQFKISDEDFPDWTEEGYAIGLAHYQETHPDWDPDEDAFEISEGVCR